MQLTLHRTLQADCTVGVLDAGSRWWYTVEQPWANNEPFHSCVPPGLYQLEPHNTADHPNTYALVNPALNVYHQLPADAPPGARFDCLIHPANWASQLEGCIAPGLGHTDSPQGYMVTNSREAFAEIIAVLGVGVTGHTLEITQ